MTMTISESDDSESENSSSSISSSSSSSSDEEDEVDDERESAAAAAAASPPPPQDGNIDNNSSNKNENADATAATADNDENGTLEQYKPHIEFKKVSKIRLAFLRNMKIRNCSNSTKQGEIIVHELSTEVKASETTDPNETNLVRIRLPNVISTDYNYNTKVVRVHKRRRLSI